MDSVLGATAQSLTALPAPRVANLRPSGENAREATSDAWILRLAISRFWATSHKRRVPTVSPVARVLPAGANARLATAALPPSSSSATGCQVATAQIRTVLPEMPASSVPAGLNWNLLAPGSSLTFCLLERSHTCTFTVPAARSLPSGENAIEFG